MNKKIIALVATSVLLVLSCCWLLKVELQDTARELITGNNIAKGLIPEDSIKWCTLPISYNLDEGGVPDGLMDITHPSICYIADGKFSHNWWIAATPYPQSLKVSGETYENTCIFFSDNSKNNPPVNFTAIHKNPIIYKAGARYNSDPDIFFDDCDSTLYAFTRKRRGSDYKSNIVIQKSKDGEHWSEPISILKTTTQSLCPCVVKNDSCYRMYLYEYNALIQNPTSTIEIWESSSLKTADFKHIKSISWTLPSYFWHGDVVRYGNKYYMIYCGTNKKYKTRLGTLDEAKYLWIAESEDGYVFKAYNRPLLKMNGVYRSTFSIINDVIYCYFSVSNRFRGDKLKYPYGNRIGMIEIPLNKLQMLQ